MLNMIEYDDVYLKKQSAEYARIILNVCLLCVHELFWIWCSTYYKITEFTEQLRRQMYSKHCQIFRIKRFAKRIMPECRCATRNFSGQEESFVELGHFDKHFIKNTIRAFFSKIRKLFVSSCAIMSVTE